MARDRVVELRRVRAGDLRPDPRNWRRHPPGQRAALSRMLDRLGYVDAVIARLLSDFDAPPSLDLRKMYALAPEQTELKPADVEPILPSEPVSRCGDLWLLGRHRLMCGDATDRGWSPTRPMGWPMTRRGARRPLAPVAAASVKSVMTTIRPTGPRPSKRASLQWRTYGLPQGKTYWSSAASSKQRATGCETKSSGASPNW